MFSAVSNESKSEYELLREKNIRERNALLLDDDDDEEDLGSALKDLNTFKKTFILPEIVVNVDTKRSNKRKRRSNNDETFRFTGAIPLQRRRSCRIAKLPADYDGFDDIDEIDGSRISYKDDIDDLERVIFRPKKIRRSSAKQQAVVLSVDEITEELIAKIAKNSTKKVYSENGTSCHQCRQKTTDTKTMCRSGNCVGINGQICGPCLRNRYGEEVVDALKNPTWACPFCRGLCNCSFCRARAGKRPTGILAPIAFQQGFVSVKHFLENLKGYGDYANKENLVLDFLGFATKENEMCTNCSFINKNVTNRF